MCPPIVFHPDPADTYRQWRTEHHTVGMAKAQIARYRVAGPLGSRNANHPLHHNLEAPAQPLHAPDEGAHQCGAFDSMRLQQ